MLKARLALGTLAFFVFSACGSGVQVAPLPLTDNSASFAVAAPINVALTGNLTSSAATATVVATSPDGTSVTATAPCTTSGCTVTPVVPDGYDTFAVQVIDAAANVLASGELRLLAGVDGEGPATVVFGGTPAQIELSVEPAFFTQGVPATAQVTALAFDAAGRRILGSAPFPAPVAVTLASGGGALTLGGTAITAPNQSLALAYNGGALGSEPNLTGTTSGATVASVAVPVELGVETTTDGHIIGDADAMSAEEIASIPTATASTFATGLQSGRSLLATSGDLSAKFPPAGNQGTSPTCTGFAAAYGLRTYLYQKASFFPPSLTGSGPFGENKNGVFSPTFTYNTYAATKGKNVASALISLKDIGAVFESTVPFNATDTTNYATKYTKTAAAYKISGAKKLAATILGPPDPADVKKALTAGMPVVFQTVVSSLVIDSSNNLEIAVESTNPNVGHAMVIVGYDDNRETSSGTGAFKVLNSWGTAWGASGYFWIPYGEWEFLPGVVALVATP